MTNSLKIFSKCLFFCLFIVICISWQYTSSLEASSIFVPKISVKQVSSPKVSLSKVVLDVIISVENPTFLNFHCQLQEGVLIKEGVIIGKIHNKDVHSIPRYQTLEIPLTCSLSTQTLLTSALSLLFSKEISLQIRGKVGLAFLYLLTFNLPFEKTIRLNL